MPGAFPSGGYENPYKASNLDPRVDNLPLRSKEETPASSASYPQGSSAAGAGTAGLATAGAATAMSEQDKSYGRTGPAPSTGSAQYDQPDRTKMPETAAATAMSPQETASEPQQSSMIGKVLGAVGLGSLAGAGAVAATKSKDDSAVDSSEGPVTTTGTESHRSPSQSGPPPSHHRKESIPTTAYPAGPGSVKAIAPPVGGTGPVTEEPGTRTEQAGTRTEDNSPLGRDAAVGAGVVGAAGAGAVGAHEYGKSRTPKEDTLGGTSAGPTSGDGSSWAPVHQYDDSKNISQGATKDDNHLGRGAAVGAGVVGATGAGAIGAHEYGKSSAPREDTLGETSAAPTSTDTSTRAPVQHYDQSKNVSQGATAHDATTVTPAGAISEREPTIPQAEEKEDHTKRNAALVGAAGVGAAGAGAYGASEYSKDHAEKEASRQTAEHEKEMARQQKEMDKQQAAQAKQAEKDQKAVEKQASKDEKAAAKDQKKGEEEEKKRREKELAATGVGAGAAGTGAAAYGADKDHAQDTTKEGEPLQKKPSLLKRIFKRKNKDTGEDEEYEGEEEEKNDSHEGAAAAGVAGAGAAGAGTYAVVHDDESGAPRLQPTESRSTSKYEDQSGGFQKPSYNPFKRNQEQPDVTDTGDINDQHGNKVGVPGEHKQETIPTTSTAITGTTAAAGTTPAIAEEPSESAEEKSERNRLHKDPPADHPAAQRESITDLPYDSSKDPQTAGRLSEHGTGMDDDTSIARRSESEEQGEEHHKGFREKLKEKLGLGHPESDHSEQDTRKAL